MLIYVPFTNNGIVISNNIVDFTNEEFHKIDAREIIELAANMPTNKVKDLSTETTNEITASEMTRKGNTKNQETFVNLSVGSIKLVALILIYFLAISILLYFTKKIIYGSLGWNNKLKLVIKY